MVNQHHALIFNVKKGETIVGVFKSTHEKINL